MSTIPLRYGQATSLAALLVLGLGGCLFAAERKQELTVEDLPRPEPSTPEEAVRRFQVRPGFRVELVACEPQIEDPIAISFDPDGNLFVCEMRGYSERRDEKRGRISRLTDEDGDGFFESSTVFVEGLRWPTGVFAWDQGVFVTATPDLLYCRDNDGDGVADEREVVLTGFGEGARRLNVQALCNSLNWGPDHRIYGATARNGGRVGPPGSPAEERLDLRSSFDPLRRDLRTEAGTAQYGLTFGDFGRRYVCSNSKHVIAVMVSWPWQERLRLPPALEGIAVDGGAAEVFRTSPVEAWREVRTKWRVQGLVRGPVEGGGRAAGYFTSASGLCIYRGDALPAGVSGNLFVGDVGSNLVHRKRIDVSPSNVKLTARRPPDEQNVEFLTSTDNWFRPVQCANGPDGALYVVDMYREVIEHPWSFPEPIKRLLDLNSGHDRGRIWRIVPENWDRPRPEALTALEPDELVSRLDDSNGWVQDAAQQELHRRNADLDGKAAWQQMESASGRYRLLQTLVAMKGPAACADFLGEAARDKSPAVRRLAVRHEPHPDLGRAAVDENAWVRWETALRLAGSPDWEVLETVLAASSGDRWIESTVVAIARKQDRLGPVVAAAGDLETSVRLLQVAGVRRLTREDREGLRETLENARRMLREGPGEGGVRQAAATLCALDPETPAELLWNAVAGAEPGITRIALEGLARQQEDWEHRALDRWKSLPAAAREFVLTKASPDAVLDALEEGLLEPSEIGFRRAAEWRQHRDRALRRRARKLLGEGGTASREVAARTYRPALGKTGHAEAGAAIFEARCSVCHPPADDAVSTGPEWRSFRNQGKAMILENVIAPNREVAPEYLSWRAELKSGESVLGLLLGESRQEIRLRLPGGEERVLERSAVKRLVHTNRSLMPPGLEAGLTLQQMADLLAYVKGEH